MGCTLSIRVSPEIKDFVRRHSPSIRSPVRWRPRRRNVGVDSPSSAAVMRGTRGRPRFDSHFSTDRIAVIVAIDRYADARWETLDTCEADGRRMAAYFSGKGFEVKMLLGKEATRSQILHQLRKIDVCQTAVFYFAGHGISGSAGAALVPHDAAHHSHDTVDKIPQSAVQDFCLRTKAHGVLLMFDCCYGGDFCCPGKMRSGDRPSFCENQKEVSRMIISASLQGERVPDALAGGRGSPFTSALMESLEDECFSGSAIELFVSVRARAIGSKSGIMPKLGRMRGDEGGDVQLF